MNTREYITNSLYRIVYEDAYANLLLRQDASFDANDQAFITEVIFGSLRNWTLLERQWKPLAKGRIRPKTACILNMSAYQMYFMDVPKYAVVNEAVNITKKNDQKFVNAILHKLAEKDLDIPSDDSLESIAISTSHPLWMIQLWTAHYGKDIAKQIAMHNQKRKQVYGRINTNLISKEEIEKDEKVHMLDDECFTYDGILHKTEYFKEGKVVIQDINAQKPVQYLDLEDDLSVLDACAAPGSKSQQIGMYMHQSGKVIACDIYESRLQLIDEMMKRTNTTNVIAKCIDATKPSFKEESFDRILLDVPCSGMGDLSHKPEIRWHLKSENIDEIVKIQKEILDVNSTYLKKGGVLVYSTCTLNKKENERQVQQFIDSHPSFALLEEKTFFPFENGGDGFYVAKIKKL